MSKLTFSEKAWDEYLFWQTNGKKILKKINTLLKDFERGGNLDGIGKPEALKDNLVGYYSRRIDDCHRLVYCKKGDIIEILQCKGHYSD